MREWEKVNLEESRVPKEAIARFINKLESDRCLLHGFAMLDGGKLLAEEYCAPFTAHTLHRMYSVGKSFVSLAIGLLQEEGKLSLDDYIWDYFADSFSEEKANSCNCKEMCGGAGSVDEIHPWVKQLTIRQMLTMTTCHAKTTYKLFDGDWVESFFKVVPTNRPGAVFAYDTSSTHVLSALVEKLSGRKLMDYLREKAFNKIGVSKEAYYMPDPAGVSQGGSGLNCTLRDLLAVAELVLNGGVYEGEQLLPADYLREATSFQISTLQQPALDEQLGYGYQIWMGRHDCFFFYGIGGQLAVCLPKEQFILVTMGNTLENKNGIKDIFDAFFEIIYPYLEEEAKKDKLSTFSLLPVPVGKETEKFGVVRFEANLAERIAKEYFFDSNVLEISKLKLCIDNLQGSLHMTKEGKEFTLFFGLEEYVKGSFPWSGAECYCQGAWVMKDMFFIRCHIMGHDMANLYVCLRFQEAGVTVKLTKGADDMMKNFEGVASSK